VGFVLSVVAAAVSLAAMLVVYGGAEDELVRRAIVILTLAGLPFGALTATIGSYFVAHQKAYVGMIASVLATAVTVGMLLATAELGLGFNGVVAAYALNGLIFAIAMIAFAPRALRLRLRPTLDIPWVRQLLVWALPLGGTLILSSIYWKVDVVLVSVLGSNSEAALYGVAFKIVDALMVLPGYALLTLLPEFSRLSEDLPQLGRLVHKAFGLIQFAAAPMLVFFLAFADQVAEIIGGEAFTGAAPLIRILVVGVLFAYLASVFNNALIALNRQVILFWTLLLILPINVGMNVALIPTLGPKGAAIAFVVTECIAFVVMARVYIGHVGLRRPEGLVAIVIAAAVSGAAALVAYAPGISDLGPFAIIAVGGAAMTALYLGTLALLGAVPAEARALLAPVGARLHRRVAV
jgi:O-antigen/teichoic acid export membrane protein